MSWFWKRLEGRADVGRGLGEVALAFELRRVEVGRRLVVGDPLEDFLGRLLARAEVVAHQLAHADRVDADRVVADVSLRAASRDDLDEVARGVVDVPDFGRIAGCVVHVPGRASGRAVRLHRAVDRQRSSTCSGNAVGMPELR